LLEARVVARIPAPQRRRRAPRRVRGRATVHRLRPRPRPHLPRAARALAGPKVLELAAGAVRGLTAAHTCNVLHRDIKSGELRSMPGDQIVSCA